MKIIIIYENFYLSLTTEIDCTFSLVRFMIPKVSLIYCVISSIFLKLSHLDIQP